MLLLYGILYALSLLPDWAWFVLFLLVVCFIIVRIMLLLDAIAASLASGVIRMLNMLKAIFD
jgi:hypothetical protein